MDKTKPFRPIRTKANREIALMKEAHLKDLMNERRFIAASGITQAFVARGVELDAEGIAKQAVNIADALLDELS